MYSETDSVKGEWFINMEDASEKLGSAFDVEAKTNSKNRHAIQSGRPLLL